MADHLHHVISAALVAGDPFLKDVDGENSRYVHIQENLGDELVQEALNSDVDLRQYSREIEKELKEVENASIHDYIKESQNIASLHHQITACDEILARMERMLLNFQTNLGSISSEIFTLQQQSIAMNIRLKNRQAIEGELSRFVDDMVISESMINTILDTPVTEEAFLSNLKRLRRKINFAKEQQFNDSRAFHDVRDVLDKLKIKAIAKIREFLLLKIYQFRKPMANYQIPQNAMLKFKSFFEFLLANERAVAKEVRDEYVDTLSKMFYSYFRSYTTRLMKLQFEDVAEKEDLLGVDDTGKRTLFGAKPALKNKSTIFSLGSRGNILTVDLEAPIIVPHAAQKNEAKHSFESLFRSQQYALVDNSCREYLFLAEFFMAKDDGAQDLFTNVMGKTLTFVLKQTDTYVQECFDSIALFLGMHIVYRYQLLMHKRCVPALDNYWEALLGLMWPRFEKILGWNTDSIKNCDPGKLAPIDLRPHYITRRYAEFSAALVGLNEQYPNEKVNRLLAQLQSEMEAFLLKMAGEFRDRKDQVVFLINNYDMMLSVVTERTKDESKESESFKELLSARMMEYADDVLSPHFGGMIAFVKDCEGLVEQGRVEQLKAEEHRVSGLVRSFSSSWKKAIDDINRDIMRSFPNFKVGTNILQMALTQLIQYYHRFQKVLSSHFKSLAVRGELINIHHIMVEVKKYKPTF